MTPDEAVEYARECLGTKFHHQGRVCGVGIDCAGVVCHVAQRGGLHYDAPTVYPRTPHLGLLEKTLDSQDCLERINGDPKKGDILLMRFGKEPQHLGIYTGESIVHAYETVGRCVEHGLDDEWQRRVVAIYRFKENE